jgi:hypothetical protein
MSMANDWYRNSTWSAAIESNFFAKLERARTQKEQYLVIQALALAEAHPDVSLRLVDHFFLIKTRDSEVLRALLARANSCLSKGLVDRAISTMKEMLDIERRKPSQKTHVFVDYPLLVAEHRVAAEYDGAVAVLLERAGDLSFPISQFKWHAAMSIIQAALGNAPLAREHAGLALEVAEIQSSGLRFHPRLGLVGKEHQEIVRQLQAVHAPDKHRP